MPTAQQMLDTERRREEKVARCSACKQEKSWDKFTSVVGRRPFGLRDTCKRCYNKRERMRERQTTLSRYGLTKETYKELFDSQNGKCAICNQPEITLSKSGTVHKLAVDHDHITGKVRGLLCRSCNLSLGKFGDSIKILQLAISYLEKHNGEVSDTCCTGRNS